MNAYEFIAELLMKLWPTNATLKMRYYNDYDENPKWINRNYCIIDPGKCVLGISVVDDDPEECYINNIFDLKNYYIANNIKKTDKMFISTDEGKYPINTINVQYDGDICIIVCK